MSPPKSVKRSKNKSPLWEIIIHPTAENRKMMGTSFREYLLHEEDIKRHVNLVVRQRILRDTTNPFELSEEKFQELYRFDRASVQKLIVDTSRHIETPQVPIMIRVFAALHYFAHGTFQADFNRVFNKKQFENVMMVADGLQKLAQVWVKFPSVEEYQPIKDRFSEKTSFPGVIGSIDCHQFRIKKPKDAKNNAQYLNPDGTYSFNVQLICDNNLKILESVSNNGGANTDNIIWDRSRTNAILQHRYRANRKGDSWLVGDSHYRLCPWVLTPFRPATSEDETVFNEKHAAARQCSSRLLNVLKKNFRCLAAIDATPAQAQKIIDACIVLHNMLQDRDLIDKKDIEQEIKFENDDDDIFPNHVHCWQINEGAWARDRAKAQLLATLEEESKKQKN